MPLKIAGIQKFFVIEDKSRLFFSNLDKICNSLFPFNLLIVQSYTLIRIQDVLFLKNDWDHLFAYSALFKAMLFMVFYFISYK
mmetsp:Transcript_36657/g.27151  ORF Transcript_36657/g.27151 Transcript_36657/m.27151 type:complete len:83 (+) Transcript_36657:259-507(+)